MAKWAGCARRGQKAARRSGQGGAGPLTREVVVNSPDVDGGRDGHASRQLAGVAGVGHVAKEHAATHGPADGVDARGGAPGWGAGRGVRRRE